MPDKTTQNNNMTANVANLAFMGLFRIDCVSRRLEPDGGKM
jgi:hypothetical protein